MILIALASGASAAVLASVRSVETYQAQATVFFGGLAPTASEETSGSFAADYAAALGLDVVGASALADAGALPTEYEIEVDAGRNDSVFTITATGPEPGVVASLALGMATEARDFLASQSVEARQQSEDAIVLELQTTSARLDTFTNTNQVLDPSADYVASATLRDSLQRELQTNDGISAANRAELERRIGELTANLAALEPVRSEYESLQRALENTTSLVDQATNERVKAEAFANRPTRSPQSVVVSDPSSGSKLPSSLARGTGRHPWWIVRDYPVIRVVGRGDRPSNSRYGDTSRGSRTTRQTTKEGPSRMRSLLRLARSAIAARMPTIPRLGSDAECGGRAHRSRDETGADEGDRVAGEAGPEPVRRPGAKRSAPGAHASAPSGAAKRRPEQGCDRTGGAEHDGPSTAAPERETTSSQAADSVPSSTKAVQNRKQSSRAREASSADTSNR